MTTRPPDWFPLLAGAILGAAGVGLGAFGAHGLKESLSTNALGWWLTGVQYQLWHAITLLVLALIPGARVAAVLITVGTVLFSGSLYFMALTGARWLGAVTPLGGLFMIAGWLLLTRVALRLR